MPDLNFLRTLSYIGFVLAFFISGCSKQETTADAIRPVLVQKPEPATNALGAVYSGDVRARFESDLAFRIPGKIVARYVDVGTKVKAGTALMKLDPTDLQLNAQAAKAELAVAESDLALAKAELERHKALLQQKSVSQSMYDAKTDAAHAAQARLEQARARLAVASNQAAYTTLTADHDGVITAVLADSGHVVEPAKAVLRLARLDEKEILVNVPERGVENLRTAKSLMVGIWALPDLRLRGQLRELAPTADPITRTYSARVRLLDPPASVQLGMTARVLLPQASSDTDLVVPLAAVVDTGGGASVWIVEKDHASPRAVKVRQFTEYGAIIESGITSSDTVVVVGAHKLTTGQAVKPIEQKTKAARE